VGTKRLSIKIWGVLKGQEEKTGLTCEGAPEEKTPAPKHGVNKIDKVLRGGRGEEEEKNGELPSLHWFQGLVQ